MSDEPLTPDEALTQLRRNTRGLDYQAVTVVGEALDDARRELERLRGIEQRASMAAGDDEPRMPSGAPSPFQAVITARYILRGEAR